jgi:hypothetical protein
MRQTPQPPEIPKKFNIGFKPPRVEPYYNIPQEIKNEADENFEFIYDQENVK